MRLKNLNITGTAAGITLVKLLNLERHTKLVNCGNNSITGIHSPKIIRNSIKATFPSSDSINLHLITDDTDITIANVSPLTITIDHNR